MPEITEAQLERLTKLRAEVPAHLIGKLPRVTCGDCSNRNRECNKHAKARCTVCGAFVSSAHMHLDYVGHAETTSILLDADPMWFWEPLALAPDGLPQFDAGGGLWIRLTVCGVTRLGYGTADNGAGRKASGDVIKEVIGDAIRNAAMRFGVALDLWAKTDLHADEEAAEQRQPEAAEQPSTTPRDRLVKPRGEDPWQQEPPPAAEPKRPTLPMLTALATLATKKRGIGNDREGRLNLVRSLLPEARRAQIRSSKDLTFDEASHIIGVLEKEPDRAAPDPEPDVPVPTLGELLENATPGAGVFEQLKRLIREAASDAAMEKLIHLAIEAGEAGHITHGQYDALCEIGRQRSEAMHADAGWSHRGVDAMAGSAVPA
jgi:hypothetical protein